MTANNRSPDRRGSCGDPEQKGISLALGRGAGCAPLLSCFRPGRICLSPPAGTRQIPGKLPIFCRRRFNPEPQGIAVTWHEFQFGPPLLEALNTGAIDYGTTGDAPPIFAQAARADLYYVAAMPGGGAENAIIVRSDSSIHSVADLKGKKIGFAKASSAHSLLLATLDKGGLDYASVTPVYLAPADAGAAFARGAIDAWSIWDPFFAVAGQQQSVRIIARSQDTYPATSYFLANKTFTDRYPEIIRAVNKELDSATVWAGLHKEEAAKLYAEATNVNLEAQRKTVERTHFAFSPVTEEIAARQQETADRYYRLGLLPKPVNVRDIVWK
jgi:aliphatic sulfonates family ABC transporter substrate-binding protein